MNSYKHYQKNINTPIPRNTGKVTFSVVKMPPVSFKNSDYMLDYAEIKELLGRSYIEKTDKVVSVFDPKAAELPDEKKFLLIRVINFSNHGKKIIILNNVVIYIPDYIVEISNRVILYTVNSIIDENVYNKNMASNRLFNVITAFFEHIFSSSRK